MITSVVIFLYGEVPYTTEPFAGYDLKWYRMVAQAAPGLDPAVLEPFSYRLLGPYLVGLLPVPDPVGFRILAVAASLALVVLFYSFMCSVGVRPWASAMATLLFTCNRYFFGGNTWNPFQLNDILALVFVVLLFWTMLRGRWALFALILVLGALTRETAMLMVPTAAFFLLERRRSDELKALIVAAIPGTFLFLLLRAVIPGTGDYSLTAAFVEWAPKLASPEVWYRQFVNAFAPFTLLPLIFWPTTRAFISRNKYMVFFAVLVFGSTLFGENTERLMTPTFIVFYLVLAHIIQSYGSVNRGLLIGLAVGGLLSLPHSAISRYPLPSSEIAIIVSLFDLALVSAIALVYRVIHHDREPAEDPDRRKLVV